MPRTTRTFAGPGLGRCACGDDEADLEGTGIPPVFLDEEEVGEPDRIDGGAEDAGSVDPGTGGIQDDDQTGADGGDPDTAEDGTVG